MIKFSKYEGTGNDFIIIDNLSGNISLTPKKIKYLCDRRLGIGADGIILVESSDTADCFMNYYNSNGTLAEMCGNGVRCTADFYLNILQNDKMTNKKKILNIETRDGIKKITYHNDKTYSVDMGTPIFSHIDFPSESLKLQNFNFNFVSTGNPHAVTIINNLENIDIKDIGPKIENDSHFPNKINIEFVEKIDNKNYKVKVWERGCGETQACGTGACAVYSILSARQGLAESMEEIILKFLGGDLFLSQNEKGHIILRGPATFVFKGEF